jgi:hypothetical protein
MANSKTTRRGFFAAIGLGAASAMTKDKPNPKNTTCAGSLYIPAGTTINTLTVMDGSVSIGMEIPRGFKTCQ